MANLNYQKWIDEGYQPEEIKTFLQQNNDQENLDKYFPSPTPPSTGGQNTALTTQLSGQNVDTQPRSLGGFFNNTISDAGNIIQGLAGLPGAIGQAASQRQLPQFGANLLGGIFDEYKGLVTHPITHGYEHPLNTLLDILPMLKGFGIGAKAGEAGGVAKILSNEGSDLAMGKLNPTAAQQAKFAASHMGATIPDTLVKNKLAGAGLEEIQKALSPLHSQFDQIANKSGLQIGKDTLDQNLATALHPLVGDISIPADKALANKIIDHYNDLTKELGKGDNFDSSVINTLRQKYDSHTLKFDPTDPFGGDVERTMGTILRRSMQDEIPGLKDLGNNISQLKDLEGIAQKNQFKPAGGGFLSHAIPAGVAYTAAQHFGINPEIAAILGWNAKTALSNPTIAGMLSKGAIETSKITGKIGKTGAGIGIMGGALGQLLSPNAGGNEIDQTQQQNPFPGRQNQPQNQGSNIQLNPSIYPVIAGVKPDAQGNYTTQLENIRSNAQPPVKQDYPYEQYQADTNRIKEQSMQPLNQFVPQLAQSLDRQQRLNDSKWAAQEKKNKHYQLQGDDQSFVANYDAYSGLADKLRHELQDPTAQPNLIFGNKAVRDLAQYNNPKLAALVTDLQQFYDLSGRQIQGGVLRGFDVSTGINPAPRINMSASEAISKINAVHEQSLNRYQSLYPKYMINAR